MEYTISRNEQYHSTEISFSEKPSESIRNALKALKFRWHGVKKVWYGYADEETVKAAIDGTPVSATPTAPAVKRNKYGVKIGDLFYSSWGYEQTNVSFFQVVALSGDSSVRVREVHPPVIEDNAEGPMSTTRTYQTSGLPILPAVRSVFIHDDEKGDIKRLKSYAADGVSEPQFNLSSYASAYHCSGETTKLYSSWYA